jgi:type II secretory pathway pseudopilin PulG
MNLQVIAIVITVVGWPLTAFIAYRFGQHSQKLQREHAAKSAIQDRKREFLAFMQAWSQAALLETRAPMLMLFRSSVPLRR